MFNEENIALSIKEQELITKYREIMSNITINWEESKRRMHTLKHS